MQDRCPGISFGDERWWKRVGQHWGVISEIWKCLVIVWSENVEYIDVNENW